MEAIEHSVAQMSEMFLQKLAEFEERQTKVGSSAKDVSLEAEFGAFKEFTLNALRALQNQMAILSRGFDDLQMHSRRKILLLHGCAEDKDEDVTSVVVKVVVDKLQLTGFSPTDISRCHRMGKATSTRPRPILLKLRDQALRGSIWAAKTKLKGTGITASEFLTKARHDTFMTARKRFGVTKSWTRDGSVYVVTQDGKRHRVYSVADLDKLGVQKEQTVAAAAKQVAAGAKESLVTAKAKRAATIKK